MIATYAYEPDGRIRPWAGAALPDPVLTDAEIDAVAVPAGCVAGERPGDVSDATLTERSAGGIDLARWHAGADTLARRAVASLGRRNGWTDEECAAAMSITPRIPCCAPMVRRGRQTGSMMPADACRAYEAAVAAWRMR